MTDEPTEVMDDVRRALAAWDATHPRATFAEMEAAVETQVQQMRARLLEERVDAAWVQEHPACPHCGTSMVPRRRAARTVITQGDEAVRIERMYVVCPTCGVGFFPPG